MNTPYLKKELVKPKWILIDATNLVIGRLAVFIADTLRGKNSTQYTAHTPPQNKVVIINTDAIKFSGNKMKNKMYYHHTGYMGGLKGATAEQIHNKKPTQLLSEAVRRMLPDNKLRKIFMRNLYLFHTAEHKHTAQQPQIIDFASLNIKNSLDKDTQIKTAELLKKSN